MIEIGKSQIKAVKKKDKKTGKLVVAYDELDLPVTRVVANEVWRVTRKELGGQFGIDGKRKLVVGFVNGDLLALRPQGTRQVVHVDLKEIYAWMMRRKASTKLMEKARKAKTIRQEKRQRRELKRRFK